MNLVQFSTDYDSNSYENYLYTNFITYNKDNFICKGHFVIFSETKPEDLIELIKSNFKFILNYEENLYFHKCPANTFVLSTTNYYIKICCNKNVGSENEYKYSVNAFSTSKKLIDDFVSFFSKFSNDENKNEGRVYVISNGNKGLELTSIGKLNNDFIEDNYEESTIKSFNYIAKQYSSNTPRGRLTIINGPPGSGKTHFVKGLISSIKNSIVVLLPSNLIGNLDGPEIVKMLNNNKANSYSPFYEDDNGETIQDVSKSNSITVIVEDADAALVPRSESNMSVISSILNIADGIYGSLLDIRLIATTNAERVFLENALLRPGRLCAHVEINALSPQKASQVYKRLSGTDKTYEKVTTLAEVYKDHYDSESSQDEQFKEAVIPKQAPVGFGR